jgi:hypothetical protein
MSALQLKERSKTAISAVSPAPTPVEPIATRRRLPSPRPELAGFARTLNDALRAKGMSPSDLARAVWGSTRDYRGYLVAKNRDRVGNYLAGVSYPSADNLAAIAKAVGLKLDALAVKAPAGEPAAELRGALDVTFTVLDRQPGLAVMQMRKLVSIAAGIAILKILSEDKLPDAMAGAADPD